MAMSTLFQLGATGALLALLPLAMVWVSRDADKYRKLVWITVFLTFDLIVFGAFTRLSDSGLGCPDWPGCYGLANPFQAHAEIRAAETLLPDGPVTQAKAWIEMTHRYLAMAIGVLIVALAAQSWRAWRRPPHRSPWLPGALFLFVCLQGAFGAFTVTMKLQPLIVTLHLLLGMGLLALLAWLGMRADAGAAPLPIAPLPGIPAGSRPALRRLRRLAIAAALLLALQIALGGWVSANYAALACSGFPMCSGEPAASMDFGHGFTLWRALGMTAAGHYLPFPALTAIHWAHRSFALVALSGIAYTAWRASSHPALRPAARRIGLALVLQAGSGGATVLLDWPLATAILHNGGAALLVLFMAMLNYQVKRQLDIVSCVNAGSTRAEPVKCHS
jgi:cytochrome c oxidase assembly protein subunit 15